MRQSSGPPYRSSLRSNFATTKFFITLFFLISSSLSMHGQAAEPWAGAHFAGDPKAIYDAAAAITTPLGTDALVLDEQEHYSFDSDGKQVYTHYLIYKIFTSKGAEQWDSVMVHWEPWHDERPTIRARVITKDYEVHTLEDKAITDSPAHEEENETYGDQRVLRAPLPAIAPGAVVEEERTVRETAPFFASGDKPLFVLFPTGAYPASGSVFGAAGPPSLAIEMPFTSGLYVQQQSGGAAFTCSYSLERMQF